MQIVNQMQGVKGWVNRPFLFEHTKLFRAFKAAVGTCVEIPDWTVTGTEDFEIEYFGQIPAAGFYLVADQDSMNATQRFGFVATGQPFGLDDSGTVYGSAHSADSASFHHVKVKRVDQVLSVLVNGTSIASVTSSTAIKLNSLFRPFAGSTSVPHLDGYPYYVKLISAGDKRRYSKFCDPSGIVPNDLGTLGADLVDYAAVVADIGATGFVSNGGSLNYAIHNTWGQRHFQAPVVLEAGKTYRIVVNVKSAAPMSSLCVTLYYANADTVTPAGWVSNNYYGSYKATSDGRTALLVTIPAGADTANAHVGIGGGDHGEAVTVQLSIREDSDLGSLYNPAEGSDQRYTKKGQAWLGLELLSNDSFDQGNTGWLSYGLSLPGSSTWDIANGVAERIDDGTTKRIEQDVLVVGSLYQVRVAIESITGVLEVILDGNNRFNITSAGVYVFERVAATTLFSLNATAGCSVVVSSASVRHKIPIAPGAI